MARKTRAELIQLILQKDPKQDKEELEKLPVHRLLCLLEDPDDDDEPVKDFRSRMGSVA